MSKRTAPNKGKSYPADVLGAEEVEALIDAVEGRSSLALRDRAIIAVTWRGALRVSEVVALKPGDVDLGEGRLKVKRGKGGKPRVVGLDQAALGPLGEWIERRDSLGFSGHKPLFCTLTSGGQVSPAHLRRLLPQLAERAGIDKRVHPHILRHTRAKELAREGVPMNVVQAALGHSSLATTSLYLQHVAADDVLAAMAAGAEPAKPKRRRRQR